MMSKNKIVIIALLTISVILVSTVVGVNVVFRGTELEEEKLNSQIFDLTGTFIGTIKKHALGDLYCIYLDYPDEISLPDGHITPEYILDFNMPEEFKIDGLRVAVNLTVYTEWIGPDVEGGGVYPSYEFKVNFYKKIGNESLSEIPLEPIVIVTEINYTSDPYSVPYWSIHAKFKNNYSGDDLSIELRDDLIEIMMEKAEELGEDSDILFEAIKCTYNNWEDRPNKIPCYAEKAIYNDEAVWVIAFNRANGFNEHTIGHFDVYFVSISTVEEQYHIGCNSSVIVYNFGCD